MMKILIAVDGSEPALEAARHALKLVQSGLKASFVLAAVQEPVYLYETMLAPGADVLERMTGAVGGKALAAAQALFDAVGVPYEREIAAGEPAPALIEVARRYRCDAIIMGARGRGALRSVVLGSVSQRVVQEAAVPVTIVKQTPGERVGLHAGTPRTAPSV
jgi:nucleotide-binding universal stress UspA family protein